MSNELKLTGFLCLLLCSCVDIPEQQDGMKKCEIIFESDPTICNQIRALRAPKCEDVFPVNACKQLANGFQYENSTFCEGFFGGAFCERVAALGNNTCEYIVKDGQTIFACNRPEGTLIYTCVPHEGGLLCQ